MLFQKTESRFGVVPGQAPKGLAPPEGQLEGSTFEMLYQDFGVVRIEPRLLHRPVEQLLRVGGEVLVQG